MNAAFAPVYPPISNRLALKCVISPQFGTEATSAPFTAQWNAAPGRYTLTAVAYDADGVSVQSSVQEVTVVQPAISALNPATDGSLQLMLTGAPGSTNRVYVTNDLVDWTLLATVVNTTGTATVLDPDAATVGRRFYRLMSN